MPSSFSFITGQWCLDALPSTVTDQKQTSNGFFAAERSLVLLTETLDATCDVNVTQCSALMAYYESEIKSNDNCGADYAAENPMVMQAHSGFLAYEPLYNAGCLKNPDTGAYCKYSTVSSSIPESTLKIPRLRRRSNKRIRPIIFIHLLLASWRQSTQHGRSGLHDLHAEHHGNLVHGGLECQPTH